MDLETLGTNGDAVVVSIGAIMFDAENIAENGFYAVLDIDDQVARGRKLNPGTVKWWMQQSEAARRVFTEKGRPVISVLDDFRAYVGYNEPGEGVKMWGNGADFDCVILGSLHDTFGMKKPWSYSNNRCFRTLKNIAQLEVGLGTPPREGVHHNALHDAVYQAKCAQVYFKRKLVLA